MSNKRQVTEIDLRDPKFPQHTKPEDYEFRDDGAIVRKDRWEMGIQSIRCIVGFVGRDWEIADVVNAVRKLTGNQHDSDEPISLADFIKAKRKEANMTLSDLSEKTGISVSHLSNIEQGLRASPSLLICQKLSKALNFPFSSFELMGVDE